VADQAAAVLLPVWEQLMPMVSDRDADADREIGFAALLCQIENHQLADQTITIDRI
jgi:hypothetical protein